MPHVSSVSGAGDDLGSTDEVKVFKDEGEEQDEKRSSENLTEDKTSLIDLTESQVRRLLCYSCYFGMVWPNQPSDLDTTLPIADSRPGAQAA